MEDTMQIAKLWPWEGKGKDDSPDRLDAFVYSILYLLSKDAGLDELVTVIRRSGRR